MNCMPWQPSTLHQSMEKSWVKKSPFLSIFIFKCYIYQTRINTMTALMLCWTLSNFRVYILHNSDSNQSLWLTNGTMQNIQSSYKLIETGIKCSIVIDYYIIFIVQRVWFGSPSILLRFTVNVELVGCTIYIISRK